METTTAKPIGALLPGIADQSTGETVSHGPLTKPSQSLDLASLPARLDDQTLALLREIATSPLPQPVPCDEGHFAECLRYLAILPYRADDALGGKVRHRLYHKKLGGFSNEAISFLASKAIDQCHWFPTISECLKILETWPNRDVAASRKAKAELLVSGEMTARLTETLGRLAKREMDQSGIDVLPKRWKQIAAEKCYLWAWPDGRFTIRPSLDGLDEDAIQRVREQTSAMLEEWDRITSQIESGQDQAA